MNHKLERIIKYTGLLPIQMSHLTNYPLKRSTILNLFMQNKAKFRKSQMNVNNVLTRDYEKKTLGERGKTKPIKANQSQLKPIKCQNKPNSKPIQSRSTPISKAKKGRKRRTESLPSHGRFFLDVT